MEPLKKYRKSGLEHFIKFVRDLPLLSPQAIFARLEELGYRGQREARRAVSLMAYRHVRRIRRIYLDGAKREQLLPKTNTLLIGPTGCGKTHLVELLFREVLRLPTVIIDITTYSETGYVGQDPSTILTRLLHAADDNPLLASIGIVCLDEFDKIASGQNNAIFAGAGTTKDVTGLGVQRELLKMLESCEVVVPLELTHSSYGDHVVMSTADIAFVAAGAFSGFHQVAGRRASHGRIGFGRNPKAVQVARRHRRQLRGRGGRAGGQLPGLRLPARAAGPVLPLRPVRGARLRHADGDPAAPTCSTAWCASSRTRASSWWSRSRCWTTSWPRACRARPAPAAWRPCSPTPRGRRLRVLRREAQRPDQGRARKGQDPGRQSDTN